MDKEMDNQVIEETNEEVENKETENDIEEVKEDSPEEVKEETDTSEEQEEVKEEKTATSEDNDTNEKFISFEFKSRNEESGNKDPKKMSMQTYMIIGIVVVLGLILIIAVGSLASSSDEDVPVDEPNVEEKVDDKKDTAEFDDEDAKKIYEKALPFVNAETPGINLYHTDKMTVSNANLNYLRAYAFSKIQFKEGDLKPLTNEDGTTTCTGDACTVKDLLKQGKYSFNASLLQGKAKYLYGAEIANGEFSEKVGVNTTYKDGVYYHNTNDETTNVLSYHYREYSSFELDGDTLYVTDKYLYIYGTLDSRGDNYLVTIYGDSAKKKTIGSGTYLVADNLIEFIVPTYDRKKVSYKHEFKKASDGHWYWVSTELVK